MLHICCAPDASVPVPDLLSEGWDVRGYFYGGNIHPFDEYSRRLEAVGILSRYTGIECETGRYDPEEWFAEVIGGDWGSICADLPGVLSGHECACAVGDSEGHNTPPLPGTHGPCVTDKIPHELASTDRPIHNSLSSLNTPSPCMTCEAPHELTDPSGLRYDRPATCMTSETPHDIASIDRLRHNSPSLGTPNTCTSDEAPHKLTSTLAPCTPLTPQHLAHEPEGGIRCSRCIALQLETCAKSAVSLGIHTISTTLTISPHKNVPLINQLGQSIASRHGLVWENRVWRKHNGFLRSVKASRELGLYRQNYCGCVFSMRTQKNLPA